MVKSSRRYVGWEDFKRSSGSISRVPGGDRVAVRVGVVEMGRGMIRRVRVGVIEEMRF